MASEMVNRLKELCEQLKALRSEIRQLNTERVSKKSILNKAEELGSTWFSEFNVSLLDEGIANNIIDTYSIRFSRLIKLSRPNNLRKSYQILLKELCASFRDDLILPLQQRPKGALSINQLDNMLSGLSNPVQSEYLKEAIACARRGHKRAAAILGWCAAIDQIHHAIEKIGFDAFNKTSVSMTNQTQGRFKRFNNLQNINSIGELREVFDTIVLWILEGRQLIDSNQHTRLRSCFDLRCQCAHPGDAPVTEYNLLSFFSDLNEIIFRNPKFSI